ncbi:MAG: hypothetical protein M8357_01630 [Desulfobulbaceae bacterium]|nr:hypothetical protein [Desulfobulbaceae bacterium]
MRKIIAYTITGLFLAGVTGIAQAADIDFQTEGPSYIDGSKKPIVPTVVALDQGSRYIEGMSFAPRTEELKTIVPKFSDHNDFCSEGFTKEEIAKHYAIVNKIKPAAVN